MKAVIKYNRMSPSKAQPVAQLVRGMQVEEALTLLKFLPKKSARLLYKAVQSALANAEHNLKLQAKDLYLKQILINKAPTIKRGQPVSRGRWHPIRKRNSHIVIELASKNLVTPKKVAKKAEPKTVTAPAPKAAKPVAAKSKKTKSKA